MLPRAGVLEARRAGEGDASGNEGNVGVEVGDAHVLGPVESICSVVREEFAAFEENG